MFGPPCNPLGEFDRRVRTRSAVLRGAQRVGGMEVPRLRSSAVQPPEFESRRRGQPVGVRSSNACVRSPKSARARSRGEGAAATQAAERAATSANERSRIGQSPPSLSPKCHHVPRVKRRTVLAPSSRSEDRGEPSRLRLLGHASRGIAPSSRRTHSASRPAGPTGVGEAHVRGAAAVVPRAVGRVGDENALFGRCLLPRCSRDGPRPIRVEDDEAAPFLPQGAVGRAPGPRPLASARRRAARVSGEYR